MIWDSSWQGLATIRKMNEIRISYKLLIPNWNYGRSFWVALYLLDSCYYYNRIFYSGSNIPGEDHCVSSPDLCMQLCKDLPSCAAWSYFTAEYVHSYTANCFLKDTTFFHQGFFPLNNVISGLRICESK